MIDKDIDKKIEKVENILGINFLNKDLLVEALTHRSYLNENRNWKLLHNERLEFLGDAVLELIVTKRLFNKFTKFDEGKLTGIRAALVNTQMLYKVASEMGIEKYVLMSKGEAEEMGKAKESLLADVFEAILGAVYLDNGFDVAEKIVDRFILSKTEKVISESVYKDSKSRFQEESQAKYKITPEYKVIKESGPDHKKEFEVAVFVGNKKIAEGKGGSKQDAEQDAAKKGLYVFKENRNKRI